MAPEQIKIITVSQGTELIDRLTKLYANESLFAFWESRLDRVLERFESDTYDVLLITDAVFREGQIEGIETLEVIASKSPVTQVLFLVESQNIHLISSVLQAGTYQYARLPISDEELRLLIDTALEQRPLFGTNLLLKTDAAPVYFEQIVGQSESMQDVFQQMEQAAATDIPVLILGETGTGKDLVAQAIHEQGQQKEGPYIPVNVGAMPVELVGSELFGHEKGAFTGAVERREGKFEQGNQGTVFLDEIGAIDEKVQVSLLRLIEQKRFHRLGGRRSVACDVRLIAATNADLMDLVRRGQFRKDLFYRLDVFRIYLPPLRERTGDISLLIDAFLARYNQSFQKNIRDISPECVQLLQQYEWPGNVRELKNVVQRAVLVCEGETITPEHLPARFRSREVDQPVVTFEVGTPLEEMEREMILLTLSATNNNRTRTAKLLGISRRALYNRLRKYNIQ